MDNNKIGKFITALRKEKGLTQQELGKKLFVTDKAVSKWERGLSLPDITILKALATILDVDVSELLNGEKGKKTNIDVQEEIDKAVAKLKEEQYQKKQVTKKYFILIGIILIMSSFFGLGYLTYHKKYHPASIKSGENNYQFDSFLLEKEGVDPLKEMVRKSENATQKYNVTYLEVEVNKKGQMQSFTLSVNFFDENDQYVGRGGYSYQPKKLSYTYTAESEEKSLLVNYYSKNSHIEYISDQLKKIPLHDQIKQSGLKQYVISYRPNTALEQGTPIFDGRDNKKIKPLSKKAYNEGQGGQSTKDIYFVLRLNDGSSIVSGQQYLYVFDTLEETTPQNPDYQMETDYYINKNKLQFTRDYGKTWIETDLTEEQMTETLSFYKDISLLPNSWFLSTNELIPIAYFYGKVPILKLSNDNGTSWTEHQFLTEDEISYKEVTKRVVGFASQTFGYAALGTDWTMGSGEFKKLYVTYDGGKNWTELELPMNGTSHTLLDVYMYDENVGVVTLTDSMNSNFPIIYSTVSGGKTWNEVKYRESNLPDDISYLIDIDKIEKKEDGYFITLGQGNSGTVKATFRTGDLILWSYSSKTHQNIHTVG